MATPPPPTPSIADSNGESSTADAKKKKCCHLRKTRKGCMKGKGGPENQFCQYRGVRQRTWGKWVAEIREPNHGARLWLGTYSTSYEAAQAYDNSARALYGECAHLNLASNAVPASPMPDSAPSPMDDEQNTPSPGAGTSSEGFYLEELDEYLANLPTAEDFGLSGFEDILNPENGSRCNVVDGLKLDGFEPYDHWSLDI